MLTQTITARQILSSGCRWDNVMVKLRPSTDLCFDVNEALQLHGGYGYLNEYPLERRNLHFDNVSDCLASAKDDALSVLIVYVVSQLFYDNTL